MGGRISGRQGETVKVVDDPERKVVVVIRSKLPSGTKVRRQVTVYDATVEEVEAKFREMAKEPN